LFPLSTVLTPYFFSSPILFSPAPETLEHIVDEFDEFMIIATDGVWDVIDNNQVRL